MNILILSPYPPFPPHGGGTMRVYQLVRGLAQRHAVTCLTFAPDQAAEAALEPMRAWCRMLVVRGPDPRSIARRAWTTATSLLPDMALRNQSATFTARLAELLDQERFDIVQAESIEMAAYLVRRQRIGWPKPVLDQFNAEYLLQKRAAQTSFASLRRGQILPRNAAGAVYSAAQWVKLARYERHVLSQCDLALAVSEEDRQIMLALEPQATIGVVPNGVDTAVFSRGALAQERVGPLSWSGATLVFSGTLDFRPNIDAVVWFAQEVLPLIRARRPDVRLLVIGKRPASLVRAQASDGVIVLGEVADARPYLAGADVYVVPMRIGGGVRLKLLEALALEAPVVSTSMGAEGVAGLRNGEHCLLADDPRRFADAVLALLDNHVRGRNLGAAGRRLVQGGYDWNTIVPQMEHLYSKP